MRRRKAKEDVITLQIIYSRRAADIVDPKMILFRFFHLGRDSLTVRHIQFLNVYSRTRLYRSLQVSKKVILEYHKTLTPLDVPMKYSMLYMSMLPQMWHVISYTNRMQPILVSSISTLPRYRNLFWIIDSPHPKIWWRYWFWYFFFMRNGLCGITDTSRTGNQLVNQILPVVPSTGIPWQHFTYPYVIDTMC